MSELIRNRYMIIHRLGEGGMADVYLAMDTLLNREVAIKVLRGDLATDPINLLRFRREANAASTLNHPNIVEIYDVGEEDGKHYIVMEYVRGQTLKQLIAKRGATHKEEAVGIMKQLTKAIGEAHRHNIIHRDIKPQNILVQDDGTAKITDFGIALAQDAVQLTQTDSVMGSVHYMAPECARGEGASAQSDIYSLGIVFYELLTGSVPHSGDAPVQVALKHMRDEIPSVKEFNPSLPQSIENIILKSTVKNKAFRYHSASDLLADLEVCLDSKVSNQAKWVYENHDELGSTIMVNGDLIPEPEEKKSALFSIFMGVLLSFIVIGVVFSVLSNYDFNDNKKLIVVPDVLGMTFTEARMVLEDRGLHLSTTVRYELTDSVEAGKIIAIRPTILSEVERGSSISVTISEGIYFVVGDYTGMPIERVRLLLENTRVSIRLEKEYNSQVEADVVIRQELLLPGQKLDPRRQVEIKLVVSTYAEMVIPGLIGVNIQDAKTMLEEMGAVVSLVKMSTEGLSEEELEELSYNEVININPSVGSFYIQTQGAKITLYYY